ncbi:MAG: response regulator, partial [Candidatus Hydrogenedentes bacterium]|nr:response regulator [Candidatus Hydrogenedentota bacterium]
MVELKDSTVLVVDDEPDLCDMVAFEFKLQGSRVFAANNGRSALGIVESHQVNAVITDIRMAGYNGIELLDSIRSLNVSNPAVFFITAYESDLTPSEAYHKGAEGIFAKPFSLKALVDHVQKCLAPPEERWAYWPTSVPTRILERHLPDIAHAREEGLLHVGRG